MLDPLAQNSKESGAAQQTISSIPKFQKRHKKTPNFHLAF